MSVGLVATNGVVLIVSAAWAAFTSTHQLTPPVLLRKYADK
jgi:hypothetical protein